MDDWAAALVGIGGTLAGGTFGYITEHARWKREQHSRWAEERRALYSKVIAECEYVVTDSLVNLLEKDDLTIGDLIWELRPVQGRVRPLIAELELIGTEEDADAAQRLLESAQTLLQRAVTKPDAPAMPAWEEWGKALDEFKRRARVGLHLSRPSVSLSVSLGRRLRSVRAALSRRDSI